MGKTDLRDFLAKVRDLLDEALQSQEDGGEGEGESGGADGGLSLNDLSCVEMELEDDLQAAALEQAVRLNPANRPGPRTMEALAQGELTVLEAAVERTKYWGAKPLTFPVSFVDLGDPALEKRIVKQMNEWNLYCDYKFRWTKDVGICRVTVNVPPGTYSSLVGTDNKFVGSPPQPTMKLYAPGGLEKHAPAEFRRLILHEAGHFLGMTHEHLRKEIVKKIDREKAYKFYWDNYQWKKPKVDSNVLTPIDIDDYIATPYDPDSIMHYELPGKIMKDGKSVKFGSEPSDMDIIMVAALCPKPDAEGALEAVVTRVRKARKRMQSQGLELEAAPTHQGGSWDAFDDVLGLT